MTQSKLIELSNPAPSFEDPLTEVLRAGAQKLLKEALEIEIESFIEQYRELRTSDGRQRIVRNGYSPERNILTGIGEVPVKAPRARDQMSQEVEEPVQFSSLLLPKYLRKARSVEEVLPWLYLKGVSQADISEALAALLGPHAKGLSSGSISRLKEKWIEDYHQWMKRDLSRKHYVYFWADGIYSNVRMAERQCVLVIIGATASGKKELVAIEGGYRESTQSWKEVLLSLKKRGLKKAPHLAVGDGALGFWNALSQEFPETRMQRCWVHKTANILNKMPKSMQPKAKKMIHEIWMSAKKEDAVEAFNHFIDVYDAKYPKATQTLQKDRESLMSFYDFPAEHWQHIRTTNPIESTFATIRLRTAKVRNCFSDSTVLSMIFKLSSSAEKRWRRLRGYERLAEVIEGVKFVDGERQEGVAA